MGRFWMLALIILGMTELSNGQSTTPYVRIVNADILPEGVDPVIYENNKLNEYFDDTTFRESMNCRNNNLQILDNKGSQNYVSFYFENLPLFSSDQISI